MLQNYLLDTNIILDVVLGRAEKINAIKCLDVFDQKADFSAWIAPHTPAIVHYVGRKQIGNDQIFVSLNQIAARFNIAPFTNQFMQNALSYGMGDFEDAMQAACAEGICAKAIITRDKKDFQNSPIPFLTPLQFLAEVNEA